MAYTRISEEVSAPLAASTGAGIRVVLDSNGKWAIATNVQRGGYVTLNGGATDAVTAAMPLNGVGSITMIADANAIAVGDRVYTAASGKVSGVATSGCILIGQALTATPATDNSEVTVLVQPSLDNFNLFVYTATAADDTANAATVNLGTGLVPTAVVALVRTAAGVFRVPQSTVVTSTGGSAGQIVVTDSGLAVNELIFVFYKN